jgi:hypothetical protein
MTVWELLATTESRVIAWQPCEWPCLGEGARSLFWRDDQDRHVASAAFDTEGEVLVLELTAYDQIWLNPRVRRQYLEALTAQGLAHPREIKDNNTALQRFLETLR